MVVLAIKLSECVAIFYGVMNMLEHLLEQFIRPSAST